MSDFVSKIEYYRDSALGFILLIITCSAINFIIIRFIIQIIKSIGSVLFKIRIPWCKNKLALLFSVTFWVVTAAYVQEALAISSGRQILSLERLIDHILFFPWILIIQFLASHLNYSGS